MRIALLQVEEGTARGAAALHLAAYLFYSHSFERARGLLEKQLELNHPADPEVLHAQALLGFVLLEQQAQEEPELRDSSELRRALQLFEDVLQHDPQDLEVRGISTCCLLMAIADKVQLCDSSSILTGIPRTHV
jgi:tetratricopeptide (TPR) repeat protein